MLEIKDLHAFYGKAKILSGISLKVEKGESVGIIGPNGAGKSTLFKSIINLVDWRGKITFNGINLSIMSTSDIVKMGISYVPEGRKILPFMSVRENLLIGAYHEIGVAEDRIKKVYELFPILKERADQKAKTLSGGEQQMLVLGRALMMNPKLLILDEPTLGLAPKVISSISDTLENIKKEVTLLIGEQNVSFTLKHASKIYILENGKIVLEGTPEELKKYEYVARAYFGL
ncbi:TPA: ABC transporter ATP-binding protein [Candidatus Bathyarchaeota archaeon]|nr:ABC transporter ATP-binding protein [Candidatus Bathyarchaeota archaeon]